MSEPTPPDDLPDRLVTQVQRLTADQLNILGTYANQLSEFYQAKGPDTQKQAGWKEDRPDKFDEKEWTDVTANLEAPPKATLTTKTIDDRDYYYLQWREGSKIKSEYVAPVSPAQ